MHRRCSDPKHHRFKAYGGRGITVDPSWQLYEQFVIDMGIRPENTTLDRIDNDGPYSPANCRWADMETQLANRPRAQPPKIYTVNQFTGTLREHAAALGMTPDSVRKRARQKGLTIEQALALGPPQQPTYQVGKYNMTIADHARRCGLSVQAVYARMHLGWSLQDALSKRIRPRRT